MGGRDTSLCTQFLPARQNQKLVAGTSDLVAGDPGGFIRGGDGGVAPSVLPGPAPITAGLQAACSGGCRRAGEHGEGERGGQRGGERGRGRERELKEPEDRESDIAGEREGEGGGKQAGQRQGGVRPRHPSSCENTRRPLGRSPLRAQRPLFCLFCTRGF